MKLADLREKYRDEILSIADKYGADNVRVFGSVVRGENKEGSDVDFLVHFRKGTSLLDAAGLEIALADLLETEVDILGDNCIKEQLKPFILNEAIPL